MKYLFITLTIQNGEYEYNEKVLHITRCENIQFAAHKYAASFYGGVPERDGVWWYYYGGEVGVRMDKVVELTKEEYDFLDNLFHR